MKTSPMPGRTFQFGVFEVNESSGELRKHGVKIRVQEQPFQILVLLLERPNEIVGREEIRARLWPENTFVDFDNAISNAVRRLREALSDSADNPRFIETLSRRGYRFIGQVAVQSQTPPVPKPPAPKPTRIKVVPIAAGSLILGLASWWLWTGRKPDATQLTPLPLTAAPGWEWTPSFSPDGSQIAYAWDKTETGKTSHIYIKLIGSGRSVQLTTGPEPDFVPSWSPDGRSVAFGRTLSQGNAIYLIQPVGGTERKLANGYFRGLMSWSPDGRFIATGDRKSPNELTSLHCLVVENGEEIRLTTPPNAHTSDADPAFSPDGRMLLFTRCSGPYTCALYLLDLSVNCRPKGEAQLLREENGPISGIAWTADGKEAVYGFSSAGDIWSFHLMKIKVEAAAKPERLTYAGVGASLPAIALRANRLAYIQNLSDIDIRRVQSGKPTRSFASSTRIEFGPQYSPDGKHVAFNSNRSGVIQVWVCDTDGENLVQLTNSAEASGTPRWSPDGRWIAFDRHLKGGWHIFIMASDGGPSRQLTSSASDEVIPSWSQDGNWIYYASNQTGRYEIWKAPAKGGKETQVTRNGGWTAFESPDGRSLYYTKNLSYNESPSGLWQLPFQSKEERLILESVGSRAFTVKESGIYYVPTPSAGDNASVRFLDFATRKSREITSIKDFVGGFGGLTVSPDRETMLFAVAARTGSNVMVVENFK